MPYGALDFDLSDDERRKVRKLEREPLIVTSNDRAADYVSVSRADDDVPPVKRRASTPPSGWRFCCGIACLALIVVAIVIAVVCATNTNSEVPPPPPMMNTTGVAPTAAPTLPVSNDDDVVVGGGDDDDVPPTVALTFLCNHRFEEGTRAGRCMAIFSVDNPSGDLVEVPVGANNFVEPGPADRNQPTAFAVGARFGGASFEWDCTEHFAARWTLRTGGGTSVATAPRTHVDCPSVPQAGGE